jgi:dTDP-glucose pyrophosphorylase
LGAIRDLQLAVKHFQLTETLVVAGDVWLLNFDLADFIAAAQASPGCLVTHYEVSDTRKHGIIELDGTRIIGFKEKPLPTETPSRLACPCFYYLKKECLDLLDEYVANASTLQEWDSIGRFIAYASARTSFCSYPVDGRLDIGDLAGYRHAESVMAAQTAQSAQSARGT